MLDPKTLLPAVQKMLPGVDPKEIMAGIKEFEAAHPDLNNDHALAALSQYLEQQKQPASSGAPFEGLMGQFGGK